MTETGGFWAIVESDYGEYIERGYPDELSALRHLNERSYSGKVRFIPWGKDLEEVRKDVQFAEDQ